jgi:anaerobic C4-dicarboxylate transporter
VRPVATIGIVNVPVTDCTIAGAGKIKLKGKKKDNITKVQVHETLGAVVVVGFFCHNASSCQQLQDQDRQKQKCCSGDSSECKRHRFVLFCSVLFCSVLFLLLITSSFLFFPFFYNDRFDFPLVDGMVIELN